MRKTHSACQLRVSLSRKSGGADQSTHAPAEDGADDAERSEPGMLTAVGPTIPTLKQAAVAEFKGQPEGGRGTLLC